MHYQKEKKFWVKLVLSKFQKTKSTFQPNYIFKLLTLCKIMYQSTNIIQQLADYIKKNLNKGYTLDSLKFSLMSQGYSRISVERAIEVANKQIAKDIPPIKEKPQIVYKLVSEDESKVIDLSEQPKKSFWKRVFG